MTNQRLRDRIRERAPRWMLAAWAWIGRLQWTLTAFVRNARMLRADRSRVKARALAFPASAERLLDDFRADAPLDATSWEGLFRYLLQGWSTFRNEAGTGAAFPGHPSWSGRPSDELEGFARLMPMLGAWVSSGRPVRLPLSDGTELDLPETFTRGLLRGTDPASSTFWGEMHRSDQRIVEASDVALALWLFRDTAWASLSPGHRRRVAAWLSQAHAQEVLDNNWHLFIVLIDRVLAKLGHPVADSTARAHFERIKEFHLGDGWFRDGPDGRVDYYNAWGFHYLLSWIDRIDPDWDPDFIRPVQRQFLSTYRYLIGPEGFPIMGRSVHYRMAAPAPLVLGQPLHADVVSAGEARRALECTWRHFIRRGALQVGCPTQGYHGEDLRILDNYSGPASPMWSLRSLVAAFALPEAAPFWQAAPEPLAVERGDFVVPIEGAGWVVHGDQASGVVSLEIPANSSTREGPLEPFSLRERFLSIAYDRPRRPANRAARYERRWYRSDLPFPSDGRGKR